jgi:trk system potassium uptake protein TrkH
MSLLVIAGGLGPLVFLDLVSSRSPRQLSLQTKLVLSFSAMLLLAGTIGVLAAEYDNSATLGPLPLRDQAAGAFFHSANTRTAGFASTPTGELKDETQLLSMVLMAIGGATGGTSGGIKVGTFALLMLATIAAARGHNTVRFSNREFGHVLVYRALGVATLYLAMVIFGTMVLTVTDDMAFRSILFEVVSALSTTGLSTGITADLSVPGKCVLIVLMFAGRLGPLAVAHTLTRKAREPAYRLPEGHLGIG